MKKVNGLVFLHNLYDLDKTTVTRKGWDDFKRNNGINYKIRNKKDEIL